MILYHGTSNREWERSYDEDSTLFLTKDLNDAWNYAYETAQRGGSPIVFAIEFNELKKLSLEFEPDWGWIGSENANYQQSLDEVGSLAVFGNIEAIKRYFSVVKRK